MSRDCLLLVDVFNDFGHEDGDRLLRSFTKRHRHLHELVVGARDRRTPVVFANDSKGVFDGSASAVVDRARNGPASDLIPEIEPRAGDRFVVKPRYSAFDHTPLELILDDLAIDRLVLAGMSTEGCVAQTAIAARERDYKTTVVTKACATVDRNLEEIALRYLELVAGAVLVRDAAGAFDAVPAPTAAHV